MTFTFFMRIIWSPSRAAISVGADGVHMLWSLAVGLLDLGIKECSWPVISFSHPATDRTGDRKGER
jgi:hypothetical protein